MVAIKNNLELNVIILMYSYALLFNKLNSQIINQIFRFILQFLRHHNLPIIPLPQISIKN